MTGPRELQAQMPAIARIVSMSRGFQAGLAVREEGFVKGMVASLGVMGPQPGGG